MCLLWVCTWLYNWISCLLSPPLPCTAAESYTSVLSEAVLDWGSMGPGEEWVNSATYKGELGKAQLSLPPKRKSSRSTLNKSKMLLCADQISGSDVTVLAVTSAVEVGSAWHHWLCLNAQQVMDNVPILAKAMVQNIAIIWRRIAHLNPNCI